MIATWCQREETPEVPLTAQDKDALQFLYDEWAHPYFVSKEQYGRLLQARSSYAPGSFLFDLFHNNSERSWDIMTNILTIKSRTAVQLVLPCTTS